MEKNITITFGSMTGEQAIKLTQTYNEMTSGTLSVTATSPAPAPKAPKPTPAPKAPTPAPAPTPEAAPAIDLGEEAPAEKAVTMEDLVKAAQAYSKKHGRENAAKIVAKYGVKSIREIKPENFAKVLNALAV